MIKLLLSEIENAVEGRILCGDGTTVISNVSTDSRNIPEDSLFVPLAGKTFDGHDFISQAMENGAKAIFSSREMKTTENKNVVIVEDTLMAMQKLGNYIRRKVGISTVAVTGSVGKTGTKDMIASVLSKKFNVMKTQGNFNNDVGVPLTLFQLEETHEKAVLEIGMSGIGEIERLSRIIEPDIAVITNIGISHIENLGSRENILKAKCEILSGLKNNGLLIINVDDEMLKSIKDDSGYNIKTTGIESDAYYKAYNVQLSSNGGVSFDLNINEKVVPFYISVPGRHNVYNALIAIAVGIEMGISIDELQEGIRSFEPGKMRQNIIVHRGIKIINDAYNASPQSMKAAICVLKQISTEQRTIAVLGDMLELGEWAKDAHYEVGKYVGEQRVDILIALGQYSNDIISGAVSSGMNEKSVVRVENIDDAVTFLKQTLKPSDTLLVKGSRGMKMETVVEKIQKEL